jgi:hypothetical protein
MWHRGSQCHIFFPDLYRKRPSRFAGGAQIQRNSRQWLYQARRQGWCDGVSSHSKKL